MKVAINLSVERFLAEYTWLRVQGPNTGRRIDASLARITGELQLLAPPENSSRQVHGRVLWLQLSSDLARESAASLLDRRMDAALFIGQARDFGRARGFLRLDSGEVLPAAELRLPGPGMLRIPLAAEPAVVRRSNGGVNGAWSRVQGALGVGTWRRLIASEFCLVGAGRLGASVALILAHEGVSRFTAIDPDSLEAHNLGGGLAGTTRDIGLPKIEVLARAVHGINPEAEVEGIHRSVTHWSAVRAIADSDFVICAADHDSARLGASVLASLYNKPLLSVGLGIFRESAGREFGADVRLVWPGRCLLCAGHLRDAAGAQRVFASAEAERLLRERSHDWRQERAGSLASVCATAAGVAARMIEDFVEGALVENGAWTRLEFGQDARLRVSHVSGPPSGQTNCCCRFAGQGDDGLQEAVTQITLAAPPD